MLDSYFLFESEHQELKFARLSWQRLYKKGVIYVAKSNVNVILIFMVELSTFLFYPFFNELTTFTLFMRIHPELQECKAFGISKYKKS